MTYGFCVYHGIECDYNRCIDCPHNTEEDAEWFKQDEERSETETETETQGILWEGLTATRGPVKILLDSERLSLTFGKIQIAVPAKAVIEIIRKEPQT